MATIAEKQADMATLLDDLDGLLSGLGSWNRVLPGEISNNGDDSRWKNNGMVYENTDAGVYITFYIRSDINNYGDESVSDYDNAGLRAIVSSEFNVEEEVPDGRTSVAGYDKMANKVGWQIPQSFPEDSRDHDQASLSLQPYDKDGVGDSTIDTRTKELTYFMSAGNDYINIAAWNTTDSSNGLAAIMHWEYVDNKIWNDNNAPYFGWSITSGSSGGTSSYAEYGFNWVDNNTSPPIQGSTIGGFTGCESAKWGIINPDANDDTFFFYRPAIFKTVTPKVAVAYVEDIIANDPDEGAAHGDTITYSNVNYRVMRQSGASRGSGDIVTAGLRYE